VEILFYGKEFNMKKFFDDLKERYPLDNDNTQIVNETGNLYVLCEPGDVTAYRIVISPILTSSAAFIIGGVNTKFRIVSMMNISNKTYPLNFEGEFDENRIPYLMEKFGVDQYTATMLCLILGYIQKLGV
jgi:hypothetical protein